MNRHSALALVTALLLSSPAARAENRALEIMRDVDRRQQVESRAYDGAIEVIEKSGKVLHKNWHFWSQGHRGESKVLVRFFAPAEVRGVGLLTLNHPSAPSQQWLYTPSIQRDRRISPQERSARFMGTDFTNEDMEERSVENFDYELLAEEPFEGEPAYKVSAVSKDPDNTGYSKLILWVRKDIMATTASEFYVDGKLRKTLTWGDWKQIDAIWTAHSMFMKDAARGSSTRIELSNVKYNATFEPDFFTERNLKKEF